MKFTTIFVLFNAVFAFSFLFIFLMPFVVLGAGSSAGFWSANWPMAAFFAAALAALNGFFLANRRVFTLVEKEDWAGLSSLLSDRMYRKGAFRGQYVRLMVNASLLRADLAGVERLEAEGGLAGYHLLYGVKGDLLQKLGRMEEAREALERAASMTKNTREQRFLREKAGRI